MFAMFKIEHLLIVRYYLVISLVSLHIFQTFQYQDPRNESSSSSASSNRQKRLSRQNYTPEQIQLLKQKARKRAENLRRLTSDLVLSITY